MTLVLSKSDFDTLSVTSGLRDLCDQASAKCFNSTYHIITSNIIAILLGVSKIFKVSGATARWIFTDSAALPLLLFLRSADVVWRPFCFLFFLPCIIKVCRRSRKTCLFLFCLLCIFILIILSSALSSDNSIIFYLISLKLSLMLGIDEET